MSLSAPHTLQSRAARKHLFDKKLHLGQQRLPATHHFLDHCDHLLRSTKAALLGEKANVVGIPVDSSRRNLQR